MPVETSPEMVLVLAGIEAQCAILPRRKRVEYLRVLVGVLQKQATAPPTLIDPKRPDAAGVALEAINGRLTRLLR